MLVAQLVGMSDVGAPLGGVCEEELLDPQAPPAPGELEGSKPLEATSTLPPWPEHSIFAFSTSARVGHCDFGDFALIRPLKTLKSLVRPLEAYKSFQAK